MSLQAVVLPDSKPSDEHLGSCRVTAQAHLNRACAASAVSPEPPRSRCRHRRKQAMLQRLGLADAISVRGMREPLYRSSTAPAPRGTRMNHGLESRAERCGPVTVFVVRCSMGGADWRQRHIELGVPRRHLTTVECRSRNCRRPRDCLDDVTNVPSAAASPVESMSSTPIARVMAIPRIIVVPAIETERDNRLPVSCRSIQRPDSRIPDQCPCSARRCFGGEREFDDVLVTKESPVSMTMSP